MELSDQFHVPAVMFPGKVRRTHGIEAWVDPRAGLDHGKSVQTLPPSGKRTPDLQAAYSWNFSSVWRFAGVLRVVSCYHGVVIVTRLRVWTANEWWFDPQQGKGCFSSADLPERLTSSLTHTHSIGTSLFCRGWSGPGVSLTTRHILVPTLRMRGPKAADPHMPCFLLYWPICIRFLFNANDDQTSHEY
jgi:hypothetical protein